MVSFMENPINMDDLGVPPWIGNLHRLSNWKHVGLPCRKEAATKDWRRMSLCWSTSVPRCVRHPSGRVPRVSGLNEPGRLLADIGNACYPI